MFFPSNVLQRKGLTQVPFLGVFDDAFGQLWQVTDVCARENAISLTVGRFLDFPSWPAHKKSMKTVPTAIVAKIDAVENLIILCPISLVRFPVNFLDCRMDTKSQRASHELSRSSFQLQCPCTCTQASLVLLLMREWLRLTALCSLVIFQTARGLVGLHILREQNLIYCRLPFKKKKKLN